MLIDISVWATGDGKAASRDNISAPSSYLCSSPSTTPRNTKAWGMPCIFHS